MKRIIISFLCLPVIVAGQVHLKPSIGIGALPNDVDSVCTIISRDQVPWTPVNQGDTAADFTLYDINGNSVNLASVLNSGKHVLMVSGSYTCPIFRDHMSILNAVSAQYGSQIECFVVYTVEAHPTGSPMPNNGNVNPTNPSYFQPSTYGERKAIVQDLLNGVNGTPPGSYIPVTVNVPIYIDGPCNQWWDYYNAPNNAYLINTNGVVFAYHEWFSNSNPPNNQPTNIWCDIDSLLGVNSGGCTQVTTLNGTFDFQFKSTATSTAYASPGDVIDVFGELINDSNDGVKVKIRRIMNQLPSNTWESSICVTFCLPSDVDTTSVVIAAGDTVDFSFHFYSDPLMPGPDTGRARIRFRNVYGNQQNIEQSYRGITEPITTDVQEHENGISVYPNPSNGIVYIECIGVLKSHLVIADLKGVSVRETILNNGKNNLVFKGLSQGIYFVNIDGVTRQKLFVYRSE